MKVRATRTGASRSIRCAAHVMQQARPSGSCGERGAAAGEGRLRLGLPLRPGVVGYLRGLCAELGVEDAL